MEVYTDLDYWTVVGQLTKKYVETTNNPNNLKIYFSGAATSFINYKPKEMTS